MTITSTASQAVKAVFADTFFFLAALNPGDAAHGAAIR